MLAVSKVTIEGDNLAVEKMSFGGTLKTANMAVLLTEWLLLWAMGDEHVRRLGF
jgi:hypothetical protein